MGDSTALSGHVPKAHLGQYEIRGRIGGGGMGDVFEAVHTGLNKRVAIKTLRQQLVEDETIVARFVREGQLASQIRHPHIVDITDVGVIDGVPCLVMELLEGESLSALFKREKGVPIPVLVDILLPIIAALDFAHERSVIHRDMKPSNIFLTKSWNGDLTPKVLDFGISKLVGGDAQAALTTDSMFVGTPLYASPELMRSDRSADGRSDQYSMGVILYEGSVGKRPFSAAAVSALQLAVAVCEGQFAPPRSIQPEMPEEFEQIILRAMALHPDQRFPSMRALGEALLPFATERSRVIWTHTFVKSTSSDGLTSFLPSHGSMRSPSMGPVRVSSGGIASASSGGASAARWSTSGVSAVASRASISHPSVSRPPTGIGSGTPPPVGFQSSHTPPSLAGSRASLSMPIPGSPHVARKGALLWPALALFLFGVAITTVGVIFKHRESANVQGSHDATYEVQIQTIPKEASIELDGVPVGRGSLQRRLAKDDSRHTLLVSAPGFEPVRSSFGFDDLPPATVTLAPVPTKNVENLTGPKPGTSPSAKPHGFGKGPGPSAVAPSSTKNDTRGTGTDNIDPWK